MWKKLKSILANIQSNCFKKKAIRSTNRKPRWWNKDIRNKIRNKRKYFRKYKRNNDDRDLLAYHVARNELNSLIRRSKRQAEINFACNGRKDPKKFFKFYNFKG